MKKYINTAEVSRNFSSTTRLLVCSDSAYSINCIRSWAPNWEKKGWKKPGGGIKNLEIIQDCCAIYRSLEEELKLTHVGTEGNELADRMVMLGAQRKEKRTATVSGKNNSDAAENADGVIKKVVFRK